VLLQLEVPLETVRAAARIARTARAAGAAEAVGARVILDPAPAPSPSNPLPDDLLADVDYLTPNETELAALMDNHTSPSPSIVGRAQTLLRRGVGSVIVTMGEAGAKLVEREGEYNWSARPTHVVDTTAAGDTFNAALAVALASGASIEEAGAFACAAASISVSRAGAQASMPTLDEVRAVLPSDR
jgi:ribokinase